MPSKSISRRSFLTLIGGAALISTGYLVERKVGWLYLRDAITFRYIPKEVRLGNLAELDKEFDICIVGSGPAGVILAIDLVRAGFRTLIVESGFHPESESYDDRIEQLEIFQNSGEVDYPILESRFRGLGGTANLWTGRCPRLYPLDFTVNAYTPAGSQWPLTYQELEPYYGKAENTLRVRGGQLSEFNPPRNNELPIPFSMDISFLKSLGDRIGLTVDDAPTSTGLNFMGRGPIVVSSDLLPEFSDQPQATVLSGVTATHLFAESDGAITGLEVRNLDQETKTVRAKLYVLATGAFENARLLLLSHSEHFPNGLGNDNDLVGRFFSEHVSVIYHGTIEAAKPADHYEVARSVQYYEQFKQEGLGSIVLGISRDPKKPDEIMISGGGEMKPHEDNRVTLSKDLNDYFGLPGTDLSYNFHEEDLETLDKTRSLVGDVYHRLGASNFKEEKKLHFSFHPMGTCRMGDDPATSVTDRNLRLHGSPNLYLAGASGFVTYGASNPTLTIAALSHRLADHLVAQLN
jgi:choline dehydrogenase-like flavoprotein